MLSRPPLNRRLASTGLAVLVTVIVVLRVLAARNPAIVEHAYARSIYPRIAAILTSVTAWASFSLAEIIAVILIVGGLVAAVRGARRIRKSPERRRELGDALIRIALGASAAYLAFLLLWGLNYQRQPLGRSVGLPMEAPKPGELAAACAELIAESDRLRAPLDEDGAGVVFVRGGISGALSRASQGYHALDDAWPVVAGEETRAKRVLLSPVLAYLGISGIFMPFTGEANVNTTLPEWTLPFVAAHEIAHQRGFAREDEANFLAYAACARHPEPIARYAAALEGSLFTLAALRASDPAAWAALQDKRSPAVRRDLEALEAWRKKYESRAADVHERVNDAYLRAQGTDGVTTYGRMVDLLLAERRAR
jgi:hypothetical protein